MVSVRGFSVASRLLNQITRHQRWIHTSPVAAGDVAPWNHIWKPDENAPMTEKEKDIVAKRYGMLKDDYKPMENQGDYPDLEGVSSSDRDDQAMWDYPELKRNFMEPGPYYDRDRDLSARYSENFQYSAGVRLGTRYLVSAIILGFLFLNHYLGKNYCFPMMPSKKPYDESGNRIVNYSMD